MQVQTSADVRGPSLSACNSPILFANSIIQYDDQRAFK